MAEPLNSTHHDTLEFAAYGLTAPWGTVRRHTVIECSPEAAWDRIADVPNNASWFTGLVASWCEPDPDTDKQVRKVTMPTGMVMTEDIVVVDNVQRRLQYALRPVSVFTHHLATIDVIEIPQVPNAPQTCLVVYSTDMAPRPIALSFGGAIERALASLKSQLEAAAAAYR